MLQRVVSVEAQPRHQISRVGFSTPHLAVCALIVLAGFIYLAPEYVITGYGVTELGLVQRFGQPLRVFCKISPTLEILDYSEDEAFKSFARKQAEAAE